MGRNSTSTQPLGWFQLKENKPADERRRPGRHSSPQGGSNETQVHVGTATPAVLGPKARLLTLKLFQILDLRSAPSRALRKCPTVLIDRESHRPSVAPCSPIGSGHDLAKNSTTLFAFADYSASPCPIFPFPSGSTDDQSRRSIPRSLSPTLAIPSIHASRKRSSRRKSFSELSMHGLITRTKVVGRWHQGAILGSSRRCYARSVRVFGNLNAGPRGTEGFRVFPV